MADYSVNEFLNEYPHFRKLDQTWVGTQLAYAKQMNSEEAFGSDHRLALGLYTADLLSSAPRGQQARLDPDDGNTIYRVQYERLKNAATAGPRVI